MRVWVGFSVLCLLAGSRWLIEAAAPSPIPPGPRAAMHAGLLAVVLAVAGLFRGRTWSGRSWRKGAVLAGLGALVFGLPGAVVAGASGRVAGMAEELVYLLTPVAVVLVVAQGSSFGQQEDGRRLLGPALAGLAGAALLVPFTLPLSVAGDGWLAALVVAVSVSGWAAVQLHRRLPGHSLWAAGAAVAAGTAVTMALTTSWPRVRFASVQLWWLEAGVTALLDGPLLLLGVWCLREMAPVRYSAKVLLVLLIAILESAAVARPTVTWTMGLGAALMLGGAGWLLREGGEEPE